MQDIDVGKLSYVDMVALREKLDREIGEKRGEELKVLADGYVKKIQAAGFSVAEAIAALKPYSGEIWSGRKISQPSTVRAMYQDPANPLNTWSGRGRAAKWLADYEASGRSRDEFRVSDA